MPTDPALAALTAAAEGVSYESETDAPFEAFRWKPAAGADLTAAAVRELGGHAADEPVEEASVADFFSPLVKVLKWHRAAEKAAVKKAAALAAAVAAALTAPRVFKVGGAEKTIYVVGRTKSGGWAGVKTTAVET